MLQHQHFHLRRCGLGVIFAAVFAVVILAIAASLLTAPSPALAVGSTLTTYQTGAQGELPEIVGSWLVTTTVVKQNVVFPALLTFTGDGIVLADEPPLLYETTGHGAWAAAGKSGADFTFVSLVGSESGALSATMRVAGSLKYDAAADTWQGTFTYLFTDAGGAEVAVDEGTMDAVRIGVEAPKAAAASSAMLGSGAKVGEMVLAKGPDPFDLNIPPIYAFCNPNPQLVDGSKVGMPGVYTVECSLPPLPQLMIGFGWVTDTKAHLDEHWSNISTELFVNGKQVDQAAFGSLDATVPNTGLPGEDPNKVVETPLRTWNVMLENLQAGPLELRFILNVAKDVSDEMMTSPAGIYDITYKITVDPALAAPEGEPAPVALVPELITVFDGFNAAVNAHDVDKALSYFADDAVASFPNNLPEPTRFTGKDELRTWIETDAKNNIHVEASGEKTSGDTLTATVKLTEDDLPPDFALEGTVEAIVQDGKIQSFTYTLSDATIEQLKALDNAEVTADEDTMLGPGAKVGEMVLSKGPDQLDLSIPPIFPFCNANPQFVGGSKVGVPGVYTVECSMPPLPQVAIGVGLETDTQENLEKMWPAFTSELYLNGKQVDQEAFGRLDAVIPSSGLPGEDPNKVFETPLRTWNVMLNNLQPGPLELRNVWNIAEELKDSQATMPAGIYDITYKITVDPALAVAEEAPASVDLVLEQVTVFDGFNAAVNAHDVDKALSFFADDAVASFPNNLLEPTSFAGKDELRTWLATDAANNIHVETSGEKTSGDTLTATVKLTEDDLPPDFALEGTVEAIIKDGKIQSFIYTLSDATIEQLKALDSQ